MDEGTLHFLRVTRGRKRTDAGIYQCVASNIHGTVKSKNASLIVGSKWLLNKTLYKSDICAPLNFLQ